MRTPRLVAVLALLTLAALGAWASNTGATDAEARRELARMAVLSHGRPMPIDTFARLAVYELSGRRGVGREAARDWLARHLLDPSSTRRDPVFLVNHPDTLAALGLPGRGRGRYSYEELAPGLARLKEAAAAVDAGAQGPRDLVEAEILRLHDAVSLYEALGRALDFARPDPELAVESADAARELGPAGAGPFSLLEWSRAREGADPTAPRLSRSAQDAAVFRWLGRGWANPLRVIPAASPDGDWWSPESALLQGRGAEALALELGRAVEAWRGGDAAGAARSLRAFNALVARSPSVPRAPGLEILYNGSRPFLVSGLLAFVACLVAGVAGRLGLRRAVAELPLVLAFAVHSGALALRIVLTGRPPVTSLYTSFLFVAWVMLAVALFAGRRRADPSRADPSRTDPSRTDPSVRLLGSLGALLLIWLSSAFSAEGDQLGVLQAVLDSSFWLSTHVVAITVGYGFSLAAGLLGHAYLISAIARPFDETSQRRLERLLGLALMLALLFTVLGTMLGGIWADKSWGRFWGWDPKENGALLIVLWIAILQHARLGRMIEARGLAAGSVLLVVVVMFSWIGVNLLGTGLHSYGWTDSGALVALLGGGGEALVASLLWAAARSRQAPAPGVRTARVRSLRRETADTVTVSLKLGAGKRVAPRPGSYLTLLPRIGGVTYRRAYSISGASGTGDRLDITVKEIPGGVVSPWLARELKPGSRLRIAGPSGDFGIDGGIRRAAVFVAAGSGIAPLLPMAEDYLRRGGPRLILLYGSRCGADIIFRERLERLREAWPAFELRHVLDEPEEGWGGRRGKITGALVLAEIERPLEATYYLCGPESMVDEVRGALLGAGVDAGSVHEERFAPGAGLKERLGSRGGVVRLRSSARELRAAPGQSILEAALRAGVSMPHGCVAGRCRECAVRLLEGDVGMEEPNALSATERSGGVVLACVAYPRGTVEIDA